jgi:broad specificity phosphatase PhoE
LSQNAHHLRDPLLTTTGKDQCLQLRSEFPFAKDVSVLLASPLQRTIQTAAWTFGPELESRQLPFILVPNAQEISGFQCDMGWDEEYVKAKAPDLILQAAPTFDERNLDTALVNGKWNSKVWIEA